MSIKGLIKSFATLFEMKPISKKTTFLFLHVLALLNNYQGSKPVDVS
jgi:hypothetical protein